jgi:Fe-S oxidoreductase
MTRQINITKEDYTSIFKCIHCGQCTYSNETAGFTVLCPINKKGHFFSYSAGGMMHIARNLYEGKIDYDNTLKDIAYQCTTCGVCEANCGVIENHLKIITKIRKHLMDKDFPESKALFKVADRISKYKNRYGLPQAKRFTWLEKGSKRIDNPSADILYFTGCVSAFDQKAVPKALDGILSALDISYTVSSDEQCCGAPLFFGGLVERAQKQALHNIEMIEKTGIETMVTSCPTCALMFKKYYPKWTGEKLPFRVLHTMEYLDDLMNQGILAPGAMKEKIIITYHDSCHLGRGLGIYEAPRKLLKAIDNVETREFELYNENSMCCGGGGMVPVLNPHFSREIAKERLDSIPKDESEKMTDYLVSACPNCRRTLGLAARRSHKNIKVLDVCELIFKAMSQNHDG